MPAERINGIKFHLEHEPEDVLESMRGYLLAQHERLIGELALVEREIHTRNNTEFEFPEHTGYDNYEKILGHAVMEGEIDAIEAIEALDAYGEA